jgi:hypothetical protein
MSWRAAAAGVLVLVGLLPANGQDYQFSVQNLYDACRQSGRSGQWTLCTSYVAGVGQMMAMEGRLNQKHLIDDNAPYAICGQPTNAAMVQAFKNWAEKNPREWTQPLLVGVVKALNENWPCSDKVGPLATP